MSIEAYPLAWPAGWKRTPAASRRSANFRSHGKPLSVSEGARRLLDELERMAVNVDTVVISTNVRVTLAGLPRSGERVPEDPGAAVYWTDQWHGNAPRVMAIDQYDRVEDNLGALAATIEAMRAIERHGGAVILERAFQGFAALPAPSSTRPWREVLGFPPQAVVSQDMVRERYRRRASEAHPDRAGGSDKAMAELNTARDQALLECAP